MNIMNENIKANKNILLFEVGIEEIPHSSINSIHGLFKNIFNFLLLKKNISSNSMYVYYTPRRIVLFIPNILNTINNSVKKIYGPSIKQFLTVDGDLSDIGKNFLKKFSLLLNNIKIEEKNGYKRLVANKKIKNLISKKKIIYILKKLILGINYHKKMKWDNSKIEFIRPIKWITVLLNNKFLLFNIGNISTQKYTYGHRAISRKNFFFINTYEYFNLLEEKLVIISSEKRKEWIIEKIKKIFYNNEIPLINKKILILQSKLIEYPALIITKFKNFFLLIPHILLIDEINNLHTIIVIKNDNKLINKFIIIVNIKVTNKNYINIINGYKNVLESKFADILFYIKTDLNLKYMNRIDILKKILLHKKLGTVYNRTIRLKFLITNINFYTKNIKDKKFFRVIDICKLDLTTNIVQKMPLLRGKVGYIYGKYLREFKFILNGVKKHYYPRKITDKLSKNIYFSLISLIDKFDYLVSLACVEGLPTGNNDLFGIRRNRSLIIKIILEFPISISISNLIFSSLHILLKQNVITREKFIKMAPVILFFFYRKMEYIYLNLITKERMLKEISCNIKSENILILLRGIIESHSDNFFILWEKIKSIFLVLNKDIYLIETMQIIKRIKNILIQVRKKKIIIKDIKLSFSDDELIINKKIIEISNGIYKYDYNEINSSYIENYYKIQIKNLLKISNLIKNLFEKVLIMDENIEKRNSRLFLLIQFYKISRNFFIFNKY